MFYIIYAVKQSLTNRHKKVVRWASNNGHAS